MHLSIRIDLPYTCVSRESLNNIRLKDLMGIYNTSVYAVALLACAVLRIIKVCIN